MKHTNEEIRRVITDWVCITGQTEVRYLVHYLLGYYGELTIKMRDEIAKLVTEGVLTREVQK